MTGHHGRNLVVDGGTEGNQFKFHQFLQSFVHHRKSQMGVHRGIAVTGEVFAARNQVFLPVALNHCLG